MKEFRTISKPAPSALIKPFPQPDSRPIADRVYLLYTDYEYFYELNGVMYLLRIPSGFTYDGTSIPRFLWSFTGISPDGLQRAASLLHDFIYQTKGWVNDTVEYGTTHFFWNEKTNTWMPVLNGRWTREQADKLMAQVSGESGVKKNDRREAYKAVRLFGWIPWSKKIRVTLIS